MRRATPWAVALCLGGWAPSAVAEKDRFDQGEPVKNFTLKVVNPEEAGQPYVGIDSFYGPEAKTPKKAILLSFFATYCEPCKKEMPYLASLYELYRDKGLMVMVVSIDKEDDKIEFAKTLAKESRVGFPVLSDRFNIVAKRYYISNLPCVYLIDGDGKVVMVEVGYNKDISRLLLDQVRKAVGEATSDPVPDKLARYLAATPGEVTKASDVPGGEAAVAPSPAEEKSKAKKDKGKKKRGKKK